MHERAISNGPAIALSAYRCFPGSTRTFCSTQGTLYSCERTETGELFELGDATKGVDVKRAIRLTEAARLIGDCGNCVAKRLCTLCPAAISERGDSGMPDGAAFQEVCKNTIANVRTQLEEYTTIMEVGAKTLDALLRSETGDDWLNEVAILLTAEQQKEVEIGMHELDEIV